MEKTYCTSLPGERAMKVQEAILRAIDGRLKGSNSTGAIRELPLA